MGRKSMRPAPSRHTPGSHPKKCPVCNPPKGEWTERWKTRKAGSQQMKRRKIKKDPGFIFSSIILLIALLLIAVSPSEAAGADKTVEKGYYGSERVRITEKPVTGKSDTTTRKGFIGGKRIDLRVVRKNQSTETRGWVDGKYVRTKEDTQ